MYTSETNNPFTTLMPGLNRNFYLSEAVIKEVNGKTCLQLTLVDDNNTKSWQSFFEPFTQDPTKKESLEEMISAQLMSIIKIYPQLAGFKVNPEKDPKFSYYQFAKAIADELTEKVVPTKTRVDFVVVYNPRPSKDGRHYLQFPGGINAGSKRYFKLSADPNALELLGDYILTDPKISTGATKATVEQKNEIPF